MKKSGYRVLILSLVCLLAVGGCAEEATAPMVSGAWARPAERGENSAVYFTIQNMPDDDVLLEARSDVAGDVQLHRTSIDAAGSARMQQQNQIEIPANLTLEFAPGGLHIMLLNLLQPLVAGDAFELTLIFLKQGEIHVQIPVEAR